MKLKYILAACAMMASGTALAQNLQSAYFLEGYAYGTDLNPAKDYDKKGFVSMPVLGNLSVNMSGNLSLQDILYQHPTKSGTLTTFLNPLIDTQEALSKFDADNKLVQDLRLNILSVGFHGMGGFNTISIALRERTGVTAPYELFELTKDLQNKNYAVSGVNANAQAYAEVALGHSHKVIDGVRVGGKLKFLLGAGRLNAELNNLKLDLQSPNKWTLEADANVELNAASATWGEPKLTELNNGQTIKTIDFDNIDVPSPGLGGFGMAFDLGGEVDLGVLVPKLNGLKASLAVTDLGFLHWNDGIHATNIDKKMEFNGFKDIQVEDGPGTPFEDQTDDLGDRLEKLYSLQDTGVTGGSTSGLGATITVGVEYELPMYKKLSFGLLSTSRIQSHYGWNEERLFATISPCNWFEASINGGIGTFGPSMGWVVNLHPKGFNLFVGMDRLLGTLSKQGVPLKSNANFTMGINFPF